MKTIDLKANESKVEIDCRCKGWCHDVTPNREVQQDPKTLKDYKPDCRCKGWCHDVEEENYTPTLSNISTKYFC